MQGQCIDEERQEYMESGRTIPKDIDEYIRLFPDDIQALLQSLRQTIREAAPDAEETISYQMPAFKQNGMLVYFAAFKKHIGFYPTSSGIEAFKEELSAYEGSKGTVRFPIDKPLPLDLVRDIVKFRVRENLEKQRKRR
jgi:uncharacterized protein YdhG (YjbR/CyaY superfamily)